MLDCDVGIFAAAMASLYHAIDAEQAPQVVERPVIG
jgi:hypothetical protein